MMKRLLCVLATLLTVILVGPVSAQFSSDRPEYRAAPRSTSGRVGITIFTAPVSVRGAGLGSATATTHLGAGSIFANPAFIGRLDQTGAVTLSRTNDLLDITHTVGAGALRPFGGQYGTSGVGGRRIVFPTVTRTARAENERGFVDRPATPTGRELVLSYGLAATDRIAIGLSGKQLRWRVHELTYSQDRGPELVPIVRSTLAFDGGVVVGPALESLQMGASVRNYGTGSTPFFMGNRLNRIGVSGRLFDLGKRLSLFGLEDSHQLLLALDRRWGSGESGFHLGAEYGFREQLFVRGGWTSAVHRRGYSVGAGWEIELSGLSVQTDYTYRHVDVFGGVHRWGLSLGL